jgi:hypothetical protein
MEAASMTSNPRSMKRGRRSQSGITTLAITLILLVIVTMMVLFSSNVGFFEQKTTTNENRSRISQQAAEYALNLAGEYLQANRDNLISNTAGSGWLATTGTSARWAKCSDVGTVDSDFSTGHPCLSERDLVRRAQLYFWTADGTKTGSQLLPYTSIVPAAAQVEGGMGGTSAYTATSNVRALLCRLDTSDPANVHCALSPVAGNRVALTVLADAALSNEDGAKAEAKETWATYSAAFPSSSVPLVASGLVQGLGNGQIVANPDSQSNGSNIVASVWSPNNVSIDGSGPGGVGSFITCQYSEFTGQLAGNEMTMHDVKTTCPSATGNSPPCNCPKSPDPDRTSKEDWSGPGTGGGSTLHKGNDILDVSTAGETVCDSTTNVIANSCRTLPSVTFFPGPNSGGTPMDHTGVLNDDSPFEYVFGVDYVVADHDATMTTLQNCGATGDEDCVKYAMIEQFGATPLTCADLGPSTSGIVYVESPCSQLSTQIGTPDNPAIVVINQGHTNIDLKNGTLVYGMLFIHASSSTAAGRADVSGTNSQVYGSLVVEGDIKMTGKFLIVYDDTSANTNPNLLPKSAKFGRVPGSWLDAKTAF